MRNEGTTYSNSHNNVLIYGSHMPLCSLDYLKKLGDTCKNYRRWVFYLLLHTTMNIEAHVPKLETCKKLQEAGWGEKTLFVYVDTRKSWKPYNQTNGVFIPFSGLVEGDEELYLITSEKNNWLQPAKGYNDSTALPAPILSELLEVIGDEVQIYKMGDDWVVKLYGSTKFYKADNPAEAAAQLYLQLKEQNII